MEGREEGSMELGLLESVPRKRVGRDADDPKGDPIEKDGSLGSPLADIIL
jgi:hypothetical protein